VTPQALLSRSWTTRFLFGATFSVFGGLRRVRRLRLVPNADNRLRSLQEFSNALSLGIFPPQVFYSSSENDGFVET
jgi:hypothetical protein